MKTTKTYENAVKEKYIRDKNSGKLRGDLYRLTRGSIRNICISLIDGKLSKEDENVLRNYFKLKAEDDLRSKINSFDIEGFKPICNFLKGYTETIKSFDALELIALMIGFEPRPYNKYRIDNKIEEKNREEFIKYNANLTKGDTTITVKQQKNRLFASVNTTKSTNKSIFIKLLVLMLIASAITAIIMFNNQPRLMVWEKDHYIEVKFNTEKHDLEQLKLYKEERIKYFKKIDTDCNTEFFGPNNEVKIWYGKNSKKELEYFTALGLHPETAKTLNPITFYMIRKYICEDF